MDRPPTNGYDRRPPPRREQPPSVAHLAGSSRARVFASAPPELFSEPRRGPGFGRGFVAYGIGFCWMRVDRRVSHPSYRAHRPDLADKATARPPGRLYGVRTPRIPAPKRRVHPPRLARGRGFVSRQPRTGNRVGSSAGCPRRVPARLIPGTASPSGRGFVASGSSEGSRPGVMR